MENRVRGEGVHLIPHFITILINLLHFITTAITFHLPRKEGTFDFKLYWYPKFYNDIILIIVTKT